MAQSRGHGDQRTNRTRQGQQSGSKRPQTQGGSARPAPKRGDAPVKGTERMGASPRSQPTKGGGMKPKG